MKNTIRRSTIGAASAIGLAFVMAGCASSPMATPVDTSAPPAEASPAPASPSGLPKVSLATTCQLLFGSDVDGPMADAQDILLRVVDDPDLSTIEQTEVTDTIAGLGTARSSADPSLVPFIDAQIKPLDALVTAFATQTDASIDFNDYKTSGLELITQCKPLL